MNYFPNIAIISGAGRNVGKTSLGQAIIERFSEQHPIISVKVSPHFHSATNSLVPKIINKEYHVYLEKSPEYNKDSSRLLKAGAQKSYYVQCTDDFVFNALNEINTPSAFFI